MNGQWYKHLIGARTIKTGIAIFLTAVFCMALDLTPIYAILTAVVTIEPTAKASLIKGYHQITCYGNWCRLCSIIYIFIRRSITFYICIECDVHDFILYKTQIASWYECCCTNIISYDSRYS